ncbi:MAG: GNAT family N-acetyltransferase [Candidatus Hydrogenedentes bacterium]|nr:GNAT family N-acetyltransferase [Candidatus Hydrogenedentota bacterium]
MQMVRASESDVQTLARMNKMLIEDEGHRNPMGPAELTKRMSRWLGGEYEAYLFVVEESVAGYCLFKEENDFVYIRQFFVAREQRRKGIGRQAIEWLSHEVWPRGKRLRLDVLTANPAGIRFWRQCGFTDYCLTMERLET